MPEVAAGEAKVFVFVLVRFGLRLLRAAADFVGFQD
jgi:hypothetical protein